MKKLLAFILAALMIVSFAACSDEEEQVEDLKDYLQKDEVVNFVTNENGETFHFDLIDSETVKITGYDATDAKHALVIPETLDNKTVVEIADAAFRTCNSINSLTIPATVEKIGNYAFEGCELLTEINIPANVKSIGVGAFKSCTAVTKVTFAEGSAIDTIAMHTFQQCLALTSITVPAHVKTVKQGAFIGCSALAEVVIADGVEVIEKQAFQNCTALATITLPASLTAIGDQAFSGSENLYIGGATYPADSVAEEYFRKEGHILTEKPAEDNNDAQA